MKHKNEMFLCDKFFQTAHTAVDCQHIEPTKWSSSSYFKHIAFIFSFLFFVQLSGFAQVEFIDSTRVTDKSLYFWYNDPTISYMAFGPTLNPHGNCVRVVNGYVFFTWYQGGMVINPLTTTNANVAANLKLSTYQTGCRRLMISRKKLGSGNKWVTVALPAQHTLSGTKGESHKTTNLGVCALDSTIHLIFDHHGDPLHYIHSKKGAAFVPDNQFTSALFDPQQDYLVPGVPVADVTYPNIESNKNGELIFHHRIGGAVGGDLWSYFYDGKNWSLGTRVMQGYRSPLLDSESKYTYGNLRKFGNDMYYVYTIRWNASQMTYNEGLYMAKATDRFNAPLEDLNGVKHNLPILDHTPFHLADPIYPDMKGVVWVSGNVSERGDMYMGCQVGTKRNVFLRKAGEKTPTLYTPSDENLGSFYGNRMYRFTQSNGNFLIQSSPAGFLKWKDEYKRFVGDKYDKYLVQYDDSTLTVLLQSKWDGIGEGDKRPLDCFSFKIKRANYIAQTISFQPLANALESKSDITLTATSTASVISPSLYPIKYSSSNTNVATIIDGNKLHIVGVGLSVITAEQVGDTIYDIAPAVSRNFTVLPNTSKTNQTIAFTTLPLSQTVGTTLTLSATATSNLPVVYSSSDTLVAKISNNNQLNFLRAGSVTITASQAGNTVFNAAPNKSQTITVPKQDQIITIDPIPEKFVSSTNFYITYSTTSGLPVNFTSSDETATQIFKNYVTIIKAGTVTVTATVPGNEYYNEATKTFKLTVNPATYNIPSFIEAEAFATTTGNTSVKLFSVDTYHVLYVPNSSTEYLIDVPVAATYNLVFNVASATAFDFDILIGTQTLKTVSVTDVNGTGGITTFTSNKTSFSLFLPAGKQTLKILVKTNGFRINYIDIQKANQNITFPALSAKTYGDLPFDLQATASSTLPIEYTSSDPAIATIEGNKVRIVGDGTVQITANQAGNNIFKPAVAVSKSLVINAPIGKPSITNFSDSIVNLNSSTDLSFTINDNVVNVNSLTVTVSSSNPLLVSAADLVVTGTGASRSLNIKPKTDQSGFSTISITVSNGTASLTKSFVLTVKPTLNTNTAIASGSITASNIWSNAIAPKVGDKNEWLSSSFWMKVISATSIFNGQSFILQTNGILAPSLANAKLTLNNFVLFGGSINNNYESQFSVNLNGKSFEINNGSVVTGTLSTMGIQFMNGNLIGSGTLDIQGTIVTGGIESDGAFVDFQSSLNTNNFTGTFRVAEYGILSLPTNTNPTFDLIVSGTGSYMMNSDVIVKSLTLGSKVYTQPKLYTYNDFTPEDRMYLINNGGTIRIGNDNRTSQTITFTALADKRIGDAPFVPGATASSGLQCEYTSSNPAVATVVNGVVKILGIGTTTIVANQTGDAIYKPALPVSQLLKVTFLTSQESIYGSTSFVVAQNQSKDALLITHNANLPCELLMADLYGRQVYNQKLTTNSVSIPTNTIGKKGIYIIMINSVAKKIFIE